MTKAEDRIKLTIGDLLMQVHVAHARIEELEEQLKEANARNVAVPEQPTTTG